MNPLLRVLESPEWALVVKALLHTVWQGAIAAGLLALALRAIANPIWRYRLSLTALALTLLSGLVTWSALQQPRATATVPVETVSLPSFEPAREPVGTAAETASVQPPPAQSVRPGPSWTAWLALSWLCGAVLMLFMAAAKVGGAEQLRRTSRPLEDPRIEQLFRDACTLVGTTRRIRMALTDRLTSPAVAGVLVPTLIFPVSLVTTLSHEQIRFILLHELAHIRRGDYLANLFQLFAEALLFFNPAVWWISHQIRREREACCDAMAIELSGAPVDYARTLVHVAERRLNGPAAAPAFAGRPGASSLADRIQRLLVPGYRPALRLTRRAIFASFLLTGILLFAAAAGTRVTVAAILSPQQRMERIEKKLAEYDETSAIPSYNESSEAPKVPVSGRLRTADDSPLPRVSWINGISVVRHGSIGISLAVGTNGTFQGAMNPGNLILGVEAPGFAPLQFGPVTVVGTNSLDNVDLVLQRGFPATLHLVNAATGKPIPDAPIHARFWTRGASQTSFAERRLRTGPDGSAVLERASDLPLVVTINLPGFELKEHSFPTVQRDAPLRIALQPAKPISGVVRDKFTGAPVPGATIRVLHERGASNRHYGWTDPRWVIAESRADGTFEIGQLKSATRYWLGVSAPGHESVILERPPGESSVEARLGPELVVRGTVTGNFEGLQRINQELAFRCSQSQIFDNASHPEGLWVPLRVTNGIGHFQFTNRTAGTVSLAAQSGESFSRLVEAPITAWTLQLNEPPAQETNIPHREVVFRFVNSKGPAPRGTIAVRTAANPKLRVYYHEEKELVNGEVRIAIPIGLETSIEPRRMIGYWFDSAGVNGSLLSIPVTNGPGPLIIQIPVVPAGAIYARAFGPDGSPLGGLFFGIHEIRRSPHRNGNSSLHSNGDGFQDDTPRKWASPALPLGGTYRVYAWRGNAFCLSQPITLTESEPDAEIQLRFPLGKTFEGLVLAPGGKPLANAELKAWFTLNDSHGFGLKPVFTDENGRFRISDVTPELGEYALEPTSPGIMSERVPLRPGTVAQTLRLKPGRRLGGRVVENESGDPIPGLGLRAFPGSDGGATVTTRTDADGRFLFSTLKAAEYHIFVEDAQQLDSRKLPADGRTNHVLKVKLQPRSH